MVINNVGNIISKITVGIGNNVSSSLHRILKQQPSSNHNPTSISSLLPRTPKDVTLTPITPEGSSVMDTSVCNQDDNDNGVIEDDKLLFAGLSVSELTSVENVEDGISNTSMSHLFPETKIDSEASISGVSNAT